MTISLPARLSAGWCSQLPNEGGRIVMFDEASDQATGRRGAKGNALGRCNGLEKTHQILPWSIVFAILTKIKRTRHIDSFSSVMEQSSRNALEWNHPCLRCLGWAKTTIIWKWNSGQSIVLEDLSFLPKAVF
jgi:hypothetical protein